MNTRGERTTDVRWVTLTPGDAARATRVGEDRRRRAIELGRRCQYGERSTEQRHASDVAGAIGELVYARYSGQPWDEEFRTTTGHTDFGDLEVRHAALHDYALIVRPTDPDGIRVALVTGMGPSYALRGWIRVVDARREEWLKDCAVARRPRVWFVPQSALTPFPEKTTAPFDVGGTVKFVKDLPRRPGQP